MQQIISFNVNAEAEIKFAWCPPGSFTLSTKGTSLFYLTKQKEISVVFYEGFWIGTTPITFKHWKNVIGESGRFKNTFESDIPVFGIDYSEASNFLKRLNQIVKDKIPNQEFSFSFPNFLQWQYACEAKRTFGESLFWRSYDEFTEYAWFKDNSNNKVHEVATKKPNPWGIYDMYGNVYEIVLPVTATEGQAEIINPETTLIGETMSVTGGSYSSTFAECTSGKRQYIAFENSFVEPLGVRLVTKGQYLS